VYRYGESPSEVHISYWRIGPLDMPAFPCRPQPDGRYPGVVLYSEIFQITAPIKRLAANVASHGFFVLVPEVYHEFLAPGTVLEYTPEGATRGNALKAEKELAAFDSDARASVDYLKSSLFCSGSVAAMGLCLGGGLAFRAALLPDVSATVSSWIRGIILVSCFPLFASTDSPHTYQFFLSETAVQVTWYATDIHKRSLGKGACDDTLVRAGDIHGELCCIWGRQDPHVDTAGRRIIYDALSEAGRSFEWHEFNAGAHGC
jgi:carboxymethylenebutenolidase